MSLSGLFQFKLDNEHNRALVLETGAEQLLSVSFADLRQVCENLADKLRLAGLGSGDVVGLVSPHSFETAMALVGLATSGCTCAPMDPATSVKRFEEILEETGTKLLLVGLIPVLNRNSSCPCHGMENKIQTFVFIPTLCRYLLSIKLTVRMH
jgi:acyl-coenzyme A synthetase/AMP-(fatty) acid ligase